MIGVKNIGQANDRTLAIEWTDQKQQSLDVVNLRRNCPCAACVNEMTGLRTLKPESIAETVRPLNIKSVGRYALGIHFSDGHQTGIYTFDYLRGL